MRCIKIKRLIFYVIAIYLLKYFISFLQREDEENTLNQELNINDNQNQEFAQKDTIHDTNEKVTVNIEVENEGEGAKQPLADYLSGFDLPSSKYTPCSNVIRPKPEDITWRKGVYQYQPFLLYNLFKEPLPERDAFIMKFYYDDRFPEIFIRGTIIIKTFGPLSDKRSNEERKKDITWQMAWALYTTPWWVYLWYEDFENPLLVKCYLKNSGGVDRIVQNMVLSEHTVTCQVPNIAILPTHASLVRSSACDAPTTYVEIVYSLPASEEDKHRIGICMASLFGDMKRENVPYFVNWMETLHVLGVSEVTMNNASVQFKDSIVYDAFNYYKSIGRLELTHYPSIHLIWDRDTEDHAATEAINKITTGDCFYRNVKRYWYTLIIDMDEIPIPKYHNTYQEFLLDYFAKNPDHSDDHSLAARSTCFYSNGINSNSEYGEHLPVLRMTNMLKLNPVNTGGYGVTKSFHNNKNVVASGHHQVRGTYPDKDEFRHTFLSETEILIHRFKDQCMWNNYCDGDLDGALQDSIIPSKFGKEVKDKVEYVLRKIGYEF